MRKSKGYAKGGAKMMRARGGKMAKGYAKGGAKMMKAMGGKMAKGYAKGGAKMMKAGKGGFTSPAKLIKRDNRAMTKKALRSGLKTSSQKQVEQYKDLVKGFNELVGKLPLPTSRKALVKKGIRKLVMPAMKNLGTVKASKVKTIKSVRGMKKK
tara:strand:- start:987 stop:1448 length:462 start_codon:yes stop_codon:yes gene_type:complete